LNEGSKKGLFSAESCGETVREDYRMVGAVLRSS
jgi:hypothetical protein